MDFQSEKIISHIYLRVLCSFEPAALHNSWSMSTSTGPKNHVRWTRIMHGTLFDIYSLSQRF